MDTQFWIVTQKRLAVEYASGHHDGLVDGYFWGFAFGFVAALLLVVIVKRLRNIPSL